MIRYRRLTVTGEPRPSRWQRFRRWAGWPIAIVGLCWLIASCIENWGR